ncbi:MAG: tRNA 2-thiouridine(34) synthase MnmA [Candidatus Paceibacterota bacterium]
MKKEGDSAKSHVFVALSGGVDSAVSAALLKEQGYAVTGAFIRTWQPDFLSCQAPADRDDARRVAAHLGIPFTTIDLEDVYKHNVADRMIEEYRAGRTPNPDVLCNQQVKFGAFLNEALRRGADAIATGHYVRVHQHKEGGSYSLSRGIDENKDQSYFLWTLGQDQLAKTVFPVGEYKKPHVRAIAEKFGLPVARKKDSQGVCFLGKLDMKEFLHHYIDAREGDVLDTTGKVIGRHDGAIFYTLGQRHGFEVTVKSPDTGPLYVVAKNCASNTLTVSEHNERSLIDQTDSVSLSDIHWVEGAPKNGTYGVQFRYRQPVRTATIRTDEKSGVTVTFREPQQAVALGQSLVIYDGDRCIGGGVIERTHTVHAPSTSFETAKVGV